MPVTRDRVLRTARGRVVVVIATVVSILAVLLLAAAAKNDITISSDEATATAEVLSADRFRSAIVFVTPDGETRSPQLGVLYPAQLVPGQRIEVEYARSDPDLVRVAGRNATTAIIPVLSVIVVTWMIAGALLVALGRRTGRTSNGQSPSVVRSDVT